MNFRVGAVYGCAVSVSLASQSIISPASREKVRRVVTRLCSVSCEIMHL